MDTQEHDMIYLMEECTELATECNDLAQAAAKAMRFGPDEQRDLPTTNRERMQKEFNDLLAVVDRLNDRHGLGLHRDPRLIHHKLAKMDRYEAYSEACGTLK